MYFVAHDAPPEHKAIAELMNQGMDSEQLFKAAFSFHQLIVGTEFAEKDKTTVQNGLFKGMILNPESFSSQFLPKYIGTYEGEVQDHLASIKTPLDCFLNIGCADGFYIAGIALWLRIPCVGVDINPCSAAAITHVGKANGVSDLVSFSSSISEAVPKLSSSLLILIDVDGAESRVLSELLDALSKNQKIKHAHLILETDFNAQGDGMNHDVLINSLCAQQWTIQHLLQQDPSKRFLPRYSHLSFLQQVSQAAEGRPSEQSWIVAQRTYSRE